jgi:hypothetical protein
LQLPFPEWVNEACYFLDFFLAYNFDQLELMVRMVKAACERNLIFQGFKFIRLEKQRLVNLCGFRVDWLLALQ